jgi:hypothetical protein
MGNSRHTRSRPTSLPGRRRPLLSEAGRALSSPRPAAPSPLPDRWRPLLSQAGRALLLSQAGRALLLSKAGCARLLALAAVLGLLDRRSSTCSGDGGPDLAVAFFFFFG